MRLPAEISQTGLSGYGFTSHLRRRIAFERNMKTVVVVIIPERFMLSFQLDRIPEQRPIKKLPANGSDKSLNERM